MICNKDVFENPCKNCKSKYVVIADSAETGEELYFCYEEKEQAVANKDHCEQFNDIEGFTTVPKTSILMIPRGE